MDPFVRLILLLLTLYSWVVIIYAIFSWLVAFNVINTYSEASRTIGRFLSAAVEPLLRPIRRVVPLVGGVDISPLILLIGIWFLRELIVWGYWRVLA